MIIWINGSFGSGKTSVSLELNRLLENSHIYDPEEIGFFIRDNIPSALRKGDFQDYPLWREFNNKMLKFMAREYDGTLIVPMTIFRKDYLSEVLNDLAKEKIEIKHFTLLASEETLTERLNIRGDSDNEWVHSRIKKCAESFEDDYFEGKIDTEVLSVTEIAEKIIEEIKV